MHAIENAKMRDTIENANFPFFTGCIKDVSMMYDACMLVHCFTGSLQLEGPAQARFGTQIRHPKDMRASQWPAGVIRALKENCCFVWAGKAANVSKYQQMSANVSKCQQMSAFT